MNDFRSAWIAAGLGDGTTGNIDSTIKKQLGNPYQAKVDQLPDGTIVKVDKTFKLVFNGCLHSWSPTGYTDRSPLPAGRLSVITPECVVETMAAGYAPQTRMGM